MTDIVVTHTPNRTRLTIRLINGMRCQSRLILVVDHCRSSAIDQRPHTRTAFTRCHLYSYFHSFLSIPSFPSSPNHHHFLFITIINWQYELNCWLSMLIFFIHWCSIQYTNIVRMIVMLLVIMLIMMITMLENDEHTCFDQLTLIWYESCFLLIVDRYSLSKYLVVISSLSLSQLIRIHVRVLLLMR